MTDGMVTVSRVRRVGGRGRGGRVSPLSGSGRALIQSLDWGEERAAELGWELKELACL